MTHAQRNTSGTGRLARSVTACGAALCIWLAAGCGGGEPIMELDSVRVQAAEAGVSTIAVRVELWMKDNRVQSLPSDFTLERLTSGDSPYMRPNDIIDPWGNPYVLRNPGTENPKFDIVSYGADGAPGGDSGPDQDIVGGK